MIKSFKSKGLEQFAANGATRKLAVQKPQRIAEILTALAAATKPSDMNLPGLRFHNLAPAQPSRYAVTVSGNYRITFAWDGQGAVDVDLEDYH